MNSKNIKKSLNFKVKDWLKHIEDERVKSVIQENLIITGGALVSLLTGEEVHDYDCYFRTKEAAETVAKYYVDKFNESHEGKNAKLVFIEEKSKFELYLDGTGRDVFEDSDTENDDTRDVVGCSDEEQEAEKEIIKPKYRPVYLTNNAITLSDKIQIIIRFWGEVEEIHKNYDFAHCTCAWDMNTNELLLPQKALECIINKELFYIGSKYPLCSIIRTRKYIERGYTINAGQYLKMCLQLNELNLMDVEVLQDQLVGVDSAYFMKVIDYVKGKQAQDENFKFDSSYLVGIINKIF